MVPDTGREYVCTTRNVVRRETNWCDVACESKTRTNCELYTLTSELASLSDHVHQSNSLSHGKAMVRVNEIGLEGTFQARPAAAALATSVVWVVGSIHLRDSPAICKSSLKVLGMEASQLVPAEILEGSYIDTRPK